jgi:hypothetical protein
MSFNATQLAPLFAWIATKYAEEIDPQLLQTPTEELWGRHVVWLFLLMNSDQVDIQDPNAIKDFLGQLSDDLMAPARQIFFETIDRRQPPPSKRSQPTQQSAD